MKDVLAFGEALIDFLTIGNDGYPILKANPGGAPCNFLAVLAHFKKKVTFCGKVGDDRFGALLLETLKDHGVDVSAAVIDKEFFTTMAFVLLDEKGDRSFAFARKPGADMMLREDEIDHKVIDDHKIIYFGGVALTKKPTRDAVIEAISYARSKKKLIAFDVNLRLNLWDDEREAETILKEMIRSADIVKLSIEEAVFLYGDIEKAKRELQTKKISFITLGEKGAITLYKGHDHHYEGQKVKVIDTTGAGDIFFGTAIAGLIDRDIDSLSSDDIDDISKKAIKISAASCMYEGGIKSVDQLPSDL